MKYPLSSNYNSIPSSYMQTTEATLNILTNVRVLYHICGSLHGKWLHLQLSGSQYHAINKYLYEQFAWWQDSDCISLVKKANPLCKCSLIKKSLNVLDSFSIVVHCPQGSIFRNQSSIFFHSADLCHRMLRSAFFIWGHLYADSKDWRVGTVR